MKRLLYCGVSLISVFITTSAFAKDDNKSQETIVITASRVETKAKFAPGNVTVISKKDIELIARPSISEMVRSTEGVSSGLYRGQADQMGEILIRGMSSQSQSMVLVDNIPVQTSYAGSAQPIGGVSVDDVERIEIVRGPFSSLYGSAAMGGVVNFITSFPKKNEIRLNLAYGDAFNVGEAQKALSRVDLSITRQFGNSFRIKLGYGKMATDGYNSDLVTTANKPNQSGVTGFLTSQTTTGGTQYIIGSRGLGSLERESFSIKAQANITDKDIVDFWAVSSKIDNEYLAPQSYLKDSNGATIFASTTVNSRAPIIEASFINTNQKQELSNRILALGWKHDFGNSKLNVQVSNLFVDEWYRTPGSLATTNFAGGPGVLTPRTSENTMLEALWQKRIAIGLFLIGAQFKTSSATADTFDLSDWRNIESKTLYTTAMGGQDKTKSLFLDYHWELNPKLSGTLGLRYENWESHSGYTLDFTKPNDTSLNQSLPSNRLSSTTPKATLTYQLGENSTIKASWGQAFRAPDARGLYRTYIFRNALYTANPFLKPEKSTSFDIGYETQFTQNTFFKIYGFESDLEDLISTRAVTATLVERINVGEAKIKGFETAFTQKLPLGFKLSANHTFIDSEVISNIADPNSVGKQLTYVPKNMTNVTLAYDNSKFFASLNYQKAAKRFMFTDNSDKIEGVFGAYDGYDISNLKLGYRISENYTVSLAISNLFDDKIYNSVVTEGRAWYLQINTKF